MTTETQAVNSEATEKLITVSYITEPCIVTSLPTDNLGAAVLAYNTGSMPRKYIVQYSCDPGQLLLIEHNGKLVNLVAGVLLVSSSEPQKLDLSVELLTGQRLLLVGV